MEKLSCVKCRPPCPLADLPSQEVRAWGRSIRSVFFPPPQAIFEQGDSQSGCYFLCEGVAILSSRTADGRRLVIGIGGPGDLVGVGSFLGQVRHELSAHALTEVRAQYLARAVCERLVQEPSLLSSRLLMALARQVKSLRMHSPLVAAGSGVRGRLAALLLQLGERFGRKLNAGGLRIELQLSCELLGQMLDSHRATVNKELIELEQRGLTERVSRQIVILDEAGLRKLAENVC